MMLANEKSRSSLREIAPYVSWSPCAWVCEHRGQWSTTSASKIPPPPRCISPRGTRVCLSQCSFFGTRLSSPTSIPDLVLSPSGDMFSGITDFPVIFTSPSQRSNEKSMGHSFRQLSPGGLDTLSVLSSVF